MYGTLGREITKNAVIHGVCIYGSGQPYLCYYEGRVLAVEDDAAIGWNVVLKEG
jgi:hypothetical protein